MLKQFFHNKIAKNAGWLIFGKSAQMLINLIVGLLTARYLGPSNYGLINYAAAYTAFFSAFCTLGLNSVLVKAFTDSPEDEGKILGTSLVLRGISSVLSMIVITAIVQVVDRGDPVVLVVVVLSSIGMIFHIFEVFNYWFQSRFQSKISAIVSLISYVITSAYKVLLLVCGMDVRWFAFATAVDYICIATLLWIAYKKVRGQPLRFSFPYAKSLLKKSWHFILPGLMVAIYAQTDKLMLKQMFNEAEVGYYSTAVALCSTWCFVLKAIIDSFYPEISKTYATNRELFLKRNRQLYAIVFYLSLFVSCLFSTFAKPIILLMYGEAYLSSVSSLRIVTWYTAFSYLGVARDVWVVCENRQKYLIFVYASSAVANVLLNWLLIPVMGAVGAAIASFVAQSMTVMVVPFFIKGMRQNSILMIEAILLKGIRKK